MRNTCLNQVHELARKDPRILFLGSDLGAGTLQAFREELPEQFLMEGISEQALVGMAAGLALEGRVVYAPLGPTHQATEDIAILRPLPGMGILAPADATEMKRLMPTTVDYDGPLYIRLGKGGDPVVTPDEPFVLGAPVVLRSGRNILLITTGTAASLALKTADLLAASGHEPGVLHLPTLKPLDLEALKAHLAPMRAVLTLEEHHRTGGLGSLVAEVLAEESFPVPKRFARLGLPDAFAEGYGSQASLMTACGLHVEAAVATVQRLLV